MKFNIVSSLPNLEVADERDVLLLQGVAFHDGVNKNNAIILKDDAKKDIHTIVGKPLRVLWEGKPTGHGYNPIDGTFDGNVKNIGYIHNAYIEDKDGNAYDAVVEGVVWKKYYPEIANAMVQLHEENKLNFSIEAEREVQVLENGERRCYNNDFLGLSMVEHPAWDRTKSVMVAEEVEGEDTTSTTQEEEKGVTETPVATEPQPENTDEPKQPEPAKPEPKKTVTPTIDTSKADNEQVNQLLQQQVEELNNRLRQFEIKDIGTQRKERLAKYIDPTKVESVEVLGALSEGEFLSKLENALKEYAKEIEKKAPKQDPTPYVNTFIDTSDGMAIDKKDALLSIMQGLNK